MFWELFFEHLRAAQRVLGAVFGKLYRGTVCFRSCFVNTLRRHSLFWELFFEDFTGAQRVLEAVFRSPQGGTACFGNCFSNTLGRHSVFWELFFELLRAAQRVLGKSFEAPKSPRSRFDAGPWKTSIFLKEKIEFWKALKV